MEIQSNNKVNEKSHKQMRLTSETHKRLTDAGFKGESYDRVINRILDENKALKITRDE